MYVLLLDCDLKTPVLILYQVPLFPKKRGLCVKSS